MEELNRLGWEGTGEERVSGAKGEERGAVWGCEEEGAETETNRRARYIGV
jgi:hypothetical protein